MSRIWRHQPGSCGYLRCWPARGLARSTIYLRIAQGSFPKPISLGPRAVGWIEAEVDVWLRQADRGQPPGAGRDGVRRRQGPIGQDRGAIGETGISTPLAEELQDRPRFKAAARRHPARLHPVRGVGGVSA